MDEVAFVESLFAPEMRIAVAASSRFPSPPPSRGRAKGNSLVPPPPNSLLGGGIALSQLQTPFQPPSAQDAPFFVRLNEEDMFSQMLNDEDFPDLHGFKKEKPSLLEPLELPRNAEPALKDAFCGLGEQLQQPQFRARGGQNQNGYTLPDANLIPVCPLGNGNTGHYYGGNFNFPMSPATQLWMRDDMSTPGSSNFQRVHSITHTMAMSMSSMLFQQPSPGSVDMFNPVAIAQHPTTLWDSNEERKRPSMKPLDAFKSAVERPPLSLTISPPASLIKELIVSADFGALDARAKRPREGKSSAQPKAKTARTISASPVTQENSSSRANGKVTKGKKCIEAGCTRRAQSNSRCKAHGGGARCQYNGPGGCTRSSQGGGFCRAHGGGKRCEFPGCTRGQQRKGRCYVHGGIRKCQHGSCEKKDRGNGFCISHGGGKRCEYGGCSRAVRRGMLCQLHEAHDSEEKEAGESVSL